MESVVRNMLKEHLPYELNMLGAAFEFKHADRYAEQRKIPFVKNAAIEAFWLHARI